MNRDEFSYLTDAQKINLIRQSYIEYVSGYADPTWGIKKDVIELALKYLIDRTTAERIDPYDVLTSIDELKREHAHKPVIPSMILSRALDKVKRVETEKVYEEDEDMPESWYQEAGMDKKLLFALAPLGFKRLKYFWEDAKVLKWKTMDDYEEMKAYLELKLKEDGINT